MTKTTAFVSQLPEKFSQRRKVPKLPLILIALVIGLGGAYAIVRSLAATTTNNCFAVPSSCGYPDATNTGLNVPISAGGLGGDTSKLTKSGSITVSDPTATASNPTVISNKDVTGTISINSSNVTIENTRVTSTDTCGSSDACGNYQIIIQAGLSNIKINNVDLAAASGATCEHDIRNLGSTIKVSNTYMHGCDSNLYSTGNTTFNDDYGIAKIAIKNDHIENIYIDDSTFSAEHSTLLNPVDQTAVIFGNVGGGSGGACKNKLTVDKSLLSGGGYVLYPCGNASSGGSSSVSVTDNRFAQCISSKCPDSNGYFAGGGSYGHLTAYYFGGPWTGNVWDNDPNKTICSGGDAGCPSTDGGVGGSGGGSTADTTAPSTPSGVTATATSSSTVSLTWSASTDNTGGAGVAGYNVFRNGTQVNATTVSGTTYQDTNLSPATAYQYTVQAVDNAGNASSMSSSVSATTLAAQTGGTGGGTTGGGTSCTPATSSATLTSVFNSATSGTIICLAAGSYTFSGGLKTGTAVTIQPQDGVTQAQVKMTINFSAASGITINGITVSDGSRISGSKTKNITVENSDFPGQITLDASTLANANILFDHNVHHDFNATGDQEGRIFVPGGDGRPAVGVTIQNSQFLRGNSDGIQNGANGLHIGPGNVFSDIVQVDSSSGVHADSIQLYGSQNTTIEGNYFHNDEDGIMCADGCDHEVVKNNVFAVTGSAFAITWLSDNGSSITHNTFVNGSSCSYGPCGIIAFGNKSSDPVSTGTTLKDNVLTSYEVLSGAGTTTGLASGAEGHNLLVNNPKAGPPSPSSTDIIGSPTYVGGANPSNYAGYALACGSLGKGNASDGTDRGINVAGASGSCGGGTTDTTNPKVSITAPTSGATVSGIYTANTTATDDTGVTRVDFYLDNGTTPFSVSTSPYIYSFDTKLLSDGSHTLKATAYDAAGNKSSATVTFTVKNPDTTKPTAPTNVKATASSATTVNLSWNASTDPVVDANNNTVVATGVAKYNVLRNVAGSVGVVIAQVTTTSYTDTTAVANTSYNYVIQAVDGADNVSTNSATATVTTPTSPDTTPPSTPSNVKATATSATQVNLTWNASTDSGGSGLAGYNVYRDGAKLNDTPVTTTSYGDSTVDGSTTYSYTIEAVDGANNKAKSSGVSVTTPTSPDTTPPSTPSNVKATATSATQVNLTWNASTDSGGSGLAGYNVYRDGTQLNTAPLPNTTFQDANVAPSTKYQYAVQAVDNTGNTSDKTSVVSVTTPAASGSGNSGDLLVGSSTIQGTADNDTAGSPEGFKYTAKASGQASTIKLYIDQGSTATSVIAGVYADSNGKPGTLLATGKVSSPSASSWNTITLNSNPAITSGQSYWIALLGTGGTVKFRDAASGNCSQSPSGNKFISLPAAWNTGNLWQTCNLSAYVSSASSSSGGSGGTSTTPTAPISISVVDGHNQPVVGATVTIGNQTVQTNSRGIAFFTGVATGQQPVTIQSGSTNVTRSVNVTPQSSSSSNTRTQHVTLSLVSATTNPALLLVPIVILVGAALIIFRPWSDRITAQAISQTTASHEPPKVVSSNHPAEGVNLTHQGRTIETPGTAYAPDDKDKKS